MSLQGVILNPIKIAKTAGKTTFVATQILHKFSKNSQHVSLIKSVFSMFQGISDRGD